MKSRAFSMTRRLSLSRRWPLAEAVDVGDLPSRLEEYLAGAVAEAGLRMLARTPPLESKASARERAEKDLSRYRFAFGFDRRHLASDGRQDGETPGALGADADTFEAAVEGAMRYNAQKARLYLVISLVEPGRRQLLRNHAYTLDEVMTILQDRPLIPSGQLMLWRRLYTLGCTASLTLHFMFLPRCLRTLCARCCAVTE